MLSTLKRLEDGTLTFTVMTPWKSVSDGYKTTVDEAVKHVEVKGFRKGNAPRDLAEKQLNKDKVYEEVIKQLVSKAYAHVLSEHKIHPIMQPDIRLTKAKEGEDWELIIETCEKPEVKLDTYKTIVQKAKGEMKKDELWLPGKTQENAATDAGKDEKSKLAEKRQKTLNTILELLLKETNIRIPEVLMKAEVDHRLAGLYDELKKLGLTVEQYMKSKQLQPGDLRKQYQAEVANTFRLELILEGIADLEKIVVDTKEIEALVANAKDPKEKESLEKNRYYLTSLLRRQKTLDRLLSL